MWLPLFIGSWHCAEFSSVSMENLEMPKNLTCIREMTKTEESSGGEGILFIAHLRNLVSQMELSFISVKG